MLTTISGATMKPVRDITRHLHHLLVMDPNPPTSQAEACTAKSNQQSDPKISHLQSKIMPQARLSILILSKAYPSLGILSPLTRHEKLLAERVCFAEKQLIVSPCFQVLAFRFQID